MTPITTDKIVATATILQRSVCLVLECQFLGNNRKVDLEDLVKASGGTTTLDEEQFHATMRLIDPVELRPVNAAIAAAKARLRKRAIPSHGSFGQRTYIVPLEAVESLDAELEADAAAVTQAAALVAARYTDAQERQCVKLGALYNANLYKTPAEVAQAYQINWFYISFDSPERLESVSSAIASSARAKAQQRMANAYDEIVATMRQQALTMVLQLRKRLTPGVDGKTRVLRDSTLRDLREYVELLPMRNIAGDDELPQALAKVAAMAEGLDVQTLRDSDATRHAMRRLTEEAATVLTSLVETGARSITFDAVVA